MVCPTFIGFGIVALTPDKSRYRTSAALELQMSGKGVYQAVGRHFKF